MAAENKKEAKPVIRPTLNNPVVRSGAKIPLYPTGDRVVVERLDGEDMVVGGVEIPGTEKDKNLYATVIAAGPPAMDVLRDMCISVGDTVCIGKWSGVEWSWLPSDEETRHKRGWERVDVINVKDIYGCSELADKIMNGSVAIDLYKESDGVHRHRFFEEVKEQKGAA